MQTEELLDRQHRAMPFWGHVLELRKRLLIVLAAVAVFSGVGYWFFPSFVTIVTGAVKESLYVTAISEAFMTRLRVSVLIGVFLSIPILLFETSLFVFPALERKEKRYMFFFQLAVFVLFILGVYYAYRLILPVSIRFLKSRPFFPPEVERLISYRGFITFFLQFLIGFGICFQFPVIVLFMLKIGVLRLARLIGFFKYFIIVAFLIAAILTPPDVVSQILLALPMILLYGLCIPIAKVLKLGAD